MINSPDLWRDDWPSPQSDAHKYHRGYLTVFGAPSLTGATRLASEAALRVGTGLVTVQCDERGDVYRAALSPEIMVQDEGEPVPAKASALLGGPGGLSDRHQQTLLQRTDLPRVIDSAALPSSPEALNGNSQTILTPHSGEFVKLFGPIAGDKTEAAAKAAQQSGCIVILKGAMTAIAHPDGRVIRHDRPNPNLATAGTGDVLAGLVAGLVAQGVPCFSAAAAGVWIHSEAADRIGPGLIASDLFRAIPKTLRGLHAS